MNKEQTILRTLAQQVREIAENPEMTARKNRWYKHNSLQSERPLVLCFPEGAWVELLPENELKCETPLFREWENSLRHAIYWWEHIRDDNTVEPVFNIPWSVNQGNFGVDINYTHGNNRGSYIWKPPIENISREIHNLKLRQPIVDREKTKSNIETAGEIFGDVLDVQISGGYWWTSGLTNQLIRLVGLENMMTLMYDEPDELHKLMAWLRDEHINFIEWFEKEGLLSLNNKNGYTGSGGVAYTDELPQNDYTAEMPVRLKDLWGFAESQETVGVSPQMFAEFVFPYQLPILEKFGLNCYGCCEAVHQRLDYILKIPRIRRISVSPWADQQKTAERLGRDYIFSRKPNPSTICAGFDETEIRKDIKNTLQIAGKGVLEIIMKDTHTVQNDPSRITDWVRIALEEVNNY